MSQRGERGEGGDGGGGCLRHANADTPINCFETPANAFFCHPTRHSHLLLFSSPSSFSMN